MSDEAKRVDVSTNEPDPQMGTDMAHVKASARRNLTHLLREEGYGNVDVKLTRWELTEEGEGTPWGAAFSWEAGDLSGDGDASIHHHEGHLELVRLDAWGGKA